MTAAWTGGLAVLQIERVVGKEIRSVEALGKNLLIRFDGDLELRTHLRMNGSWHRYRPGERWRRPLPARPCSRSGRRRSVLRCPGRRALRGAGPKRSTLPGQPRPGSPEPPRLRRSGGRPPTPRPGTARRLHQRRAARPAGARRHRQHLAQRDAVRRARRPARAGRRPRRRHARRLVASARRLLRASAGIAPGRTSPMHVYRRTGRPCPRCGTAIRSDLGENPRTTYWCPTCQARR